MKQGWEVKRLGDVAAVGSSKRVLQRDWQDTGIPFYRAREIAKLADGMLPKPALYISEQMFNDLAETSNIPSVGDIMVTGVGTVGRAYEVKQGDKFYFKDASVLICRSIDRTIVLPRFIIYFMQSPSFQDIAQSGQGATVKTLTIRDLSNVEIPLPPLEEQRRIVAVLDEAFAGLETARTNAEANLKNAEELFQSSLVALFDSLKSESNFHYLKDVASTFGRGRSRHRPRNAPHLYGGEYPFIQTSEVRQSDRYIVDYEKTYSEAGLAQSKLWPAGTLCITIAANIAETGILTMDACFPDSIIGVVCDNDKAVAEYTELMLQSFAKLLKAQGEGTAQDNINLATFESNLFPFPSIERQKEVAESLNRLKDHENKLKTEYKSQQDNLNNLRQSLLQKAFAGELT